MAPTSMKETHVGRVRGSAGSRAMRAVGLVAVVGLGLTGCGEDDADTAGDDVTTTVDDSGSGRLDEALAGEVVAHYADGVHASYTASLDAALALDVAVDAFVAAPDEATMSAAKSAWIAARTPYGLTEAFRFYGGPIDNEEDGPEGLINGWPLDEQYIDYTVDTPDSGIIADTAGFPEITQEALAEANEAGGEANLSTGWHAIEFLLWGQDLSDTGPGARPVTDYTTDPNAERRKQYLSAVTDLLIGDLTTVTEAWAPDADNYRAEFVAKPVDEALTDIITGIGELSRGELAGERMNVAFEERDQENEHSCFSDNTGADLSANANGIANVWLGVYAGAAEGPGLDQLVAAVDPDLAAQVTEEISTSVLAISEIPSPFDANLTADAPDDGPGRTAIKESIAALGTQTDSIVAAGKALGVTVEVS